MALKTYRPKIITIVLKTLSPLLILLMPSPSLAMASGDSPQHLDLTQSPVGYISLGIFVIAYLLVMSEEFIHLRKSKPVMLAAGIIWAIIAAAYASNGIPYVAEAAVRHNLLEYAELMLFLLVAMTYINAMNERQVFDALRSWLISRGLSFRQLFWMTGTLAFFISPVADNLTTALVMCAVVLAVGGDNKKFISLACVNIVVAANAGGAFSPFGDITTLMVWQKGIIDFWTFFALLIPSAINYLVPAIIMTFALPNEKPQPNDETIIMRRGSKRIIVLFMLTIITAVSFHNFLHMPPVIGMLTGLAYLQFFGFYLRTTHNKFLNNYSEIKANQMVGDIVPFDVFNKIARAEWDTLLFFYGVVLCVGGLGFIGYLTMISETMYIQWGATEANIAVGIVSSIIDNIPVMFAVLTMEPDMSTGQWLLVTLTTGVGGSLLSIGSAAGVALMGQARGMYTFFSHLKWMPVIALGYTASILAHLWLNSSMF